MRAFHAGFVLTVLALAGALSAAEQSLFRGDLVGWDGDKTVWRVRDGVIVGGSLEGNAQNEFLTWSRRYRNFHLKFDYKLIELAGSSNGGLQFRSERIPDPPNEMKGYQMDLGMGRSGFLYDESRRKRFLAQGTAEQVTRLEKRGDWNRGEVRCEGRRVQLFLNGERIVDYTEAEENIPQGGLIGLQIHGKSKAEISFRNLTIEVLPEGVVTADPNAQSYRRIADALAPPRPLAPFAAGRFEMLPGDVFAFVGSENTVIEQQSGWLEAALTQAGAARRPTFRHMGWESDTVYRQHRQLNWGSWGENLAAVGATVVIAWVGQMEVFDPGRTLVDFSAAARGFLGELEAQTPRLVVISPPPFERPPHPAMPDNTPRNAVVRQHAEALRALAAERGYVFVDLFTPLAARPASAPRLMRDGVHFTPEGMAEVARIVASQLLGAGAAPVREPLRAAIVEKNRLWFDAWRTMNWNFAYGDRTTQQFGRGAGEFPALAENLREYRPQIAHADAVVQALATGRTMPEPLPSPPPRPDPEAASPAEQMSRFKVRDGFAVNLFADENLGVVRPIQMSWDERGRLWVLCVPSYPQLRPGERANDYLLVLEDKDGDGVADAASRFAEGLTMPMGFEFGPDGVYVCESTQIVRLADPLGTGRATERRVVLSGFGTGDSHQKINSLRWGPDGWLWFTQGLHTESSVETPQGIVELEGAGLWRFNPRTHELRSYLHGSVAGQNCWGVAFDDFGQPFHGSGADRHLWHTTPALISTRHVQQLAGLAGTLGKSMSPEFLGSTHLPEELRGALVKATYFTNQVSLFRLRDDGATFESEALGDLLSSSGNEFRPLKAMGGPDGTIYVCDWVNPIIGHYQASYRDPRRVLSHGRIWRLRHIGMPLVANAPLADVNEQELVQQLASPERWRREQVKSLLYRRPTDRVVSAADAHLAELGATPQPSPSVLYELAGVYAAHEAIRPRLVQLLLASSDFRARAWGARLVGLWLERLPDALTLLAQAAQDEHPRVRLEAVVAASCSRTPAAIEIATRVLRHPMSPSLRYALTQCTHALAPIWQPALARGALDFGERVDALALVLSTAGGPESAASLRGLAGSDRFGGRRRDDVLVALAEVGDADDLAFIIEQPPSGRVIDALGVAARRRNVRPAGDLDRAMAAWRASPLVDVRAAALQLAGDWRLASQLPWARRIALEDNAPVAERLAAIGTLGILGRRGATADLLTLTTAAKPEMRVAALAVLARIDLALAAGKGVSVITTTPDATAAKAALRPFLGEKDGLAALAKAFKAAPPDAEVARRVLQALAEEGKNDPALTDVLNVSAGLATQVLPYSPERVAKLVEAAQARGDARRGADVFRQPELACVACHQVNGEGGMLGPDLSAIGRVAPPDFIVESVLWPKRSVKEGYMLTRIVAKDGRQVQGTMLRQSKDINIVRELGTGVIHEFRTSEVATRNMAESLMPDGLTSGLTEQQLSDLLRYLMERGK